MKTPLLLTLLVLASFPAQAQVYKCNIDGRTVFTDQPCEPGAAAPQSAGTPATTSESGQVISSGTAETDNQPPPMALATDATPVPFPVQPAANLLSYTVRACSLERPDDILQNFSQSARKNLEEKRFSYQAPHIFTGQFCKVITRIVEDDLKGQPANYIYATTKAGDRARLCILNPGSSLDTCSSGGIAVSLDGGLLKFEEY